MQVCAIIPARGGSKGVPGKNLRTVGGTPLIGRAVLTALAAETIDRVFVSTDDAEISACASRFGAEIVQRPAELATDSSSSERALLHALQYMRGEGYIPDIVVFIQATSPFTRPQDLDSGVRVVSAGADSAFSGFLSHKFLWRVSEDGRGVGINHDPAVRQMRQDRPTEYCESGGFYVMRRSGLEHHEHRFFGHIGVIPVPEARSLDIDTLEDLKVAQSMSAIFDEAGGSRLFAAGGIS